MSTFDSLAAAATAAWRGTAWTELVGAALAVAYLLLAIPQSILCWVAAFLSSCLYVWVLFHARLYMESVLNAFYAVMAVYGYLQWRPASVPGESLIAHRWPLGLHVRALALIVVLAAVSGLLLRRYTAAASPFLDSMVTWSSVFATFLVARKVYENWHWWLVTDSVSLGLYVWRGLYLTALLFALYIVLIFVGMRAWHRSLASAPHAA